VNKSRFLIKPFGGKSLLVIPTLILLLTTAMSEVAWSQLNDAEKQKTTREVANRWMDVGEQQYKRGYFEAAEKSFLEAQKYQKYLTAAQSKRLSDLMEKTHVAILERRRILDHIRTANMLVGQGQLIKAKVHLEKVKDSKSLTKEERDKILEGLKNIDNQLAKQKKQITGQKKQITDLYNRSVALFRAGELEKAREGFIVVASSGLSVAPAGEKTAGDYLKLLAVRMKVNGLLDEKDKALPPTEKATGKIKQKVVQDQNSVVVTVPKPKVLVTNVVETKVVKPKVTKSTTAGSFIEEVNRKRTIRRSYTKTVVEDANEKALSFLSEGEFDKAKNAVERAERVVNENQLDLGGELFKQYSGKLKQLTEKIVAEENKKAGQLAEEKRIAAIEAQKKYRKEMEADRAERIRELMANATAFQKQQRYEEALGQLRQLLALDPLHDEALTLKDTLEDTVSFRKELELRKERQRERVGILREAEEAATPYAKELTYAKNWPEIIASPFRKPDEPIGLDPADVAVYKQLEEVVDLSQLTPEMALSEAIEELKNAVDPPLTIIPMWRDLYDTANIEQTTPINMDGVPAIPLGTALENLLRAVSGGLVDLDYVVDGGVITIATVGSLPSRLVTRVYDITFLIGQPATYFGVGGGFGGGFGGGGYGGGGYGGGGYGGGGYGGGGYGGYGGGGYGGGGLGGYGGGGLGGYGGGGLGGYGGGGYGGGLGGYGGGGYGGGGLGGYGGGGYGGGLGGYGGGGYGGGLGGGGYGGYGGGGYGGGIYGGGGGIQSYLQAQSLLELIQESIEPDSWFEAGGEGTITVYPYNQPKKLAILQTPEIHNEIDKLLKAMGKALGHQVSIETRFLVVTENFLQEIGLDVSFIANFGGKWGLVDFTQGSLGATVPEVTKVAGSLGGIGASATISGGYGTMLDDLQVSFLIRATEAHTDATTLTAPKVTVLTGESATFQIQRNVTYALPSSVIGGGGYSGGYGGGFGGGYGGYGGGQGVTPNVSSVPTGTQLSITPTISPDKKNVLLNIVTNLQDLLRMKTHEVDTVIPGQQNVPTELVTQQITVPETEWSQVMTRVSVPDNGTLLLGGQKVTAEVEKEAGVPILGKLPLIGRLFSNRSVVKDHKILLILVKPTIILQEEYEAKAIAALEGEF
jgi:Flp pilus assembly secretin CpaC/tetratricopeptide (TPR) repeat protein